jgi:hypothetical protein
MGTCRQIRWVFGLFALCSQTLPAQSPEPLTITQVLSPIQSVTMRGNLAQSAVTGAPFSAIEDSLYSQRQSDGTFKDKTRTVTRIYRDSYGRTRAETSVTSYSYNTSKTHLQSIFITDPLTDSLYRLDPDNLTASRRSWKTFVQKSSTDSTPNSCKSTATTEPDVPVTTTSMGSRSIEGLTVEGTRQTMSIPAGLAGNPRPIDIAAETWVSKELQLAVLTTRNNSVVGRDTVRLTKIDRSEPDPNLFRVPPDYVIKDEPDKTFLACFSSP